MDHAVGVRVVERSRRVAENAQRLVEGHARAQRLVKTSAHQLHHEVSGTSSTPES